MQRTPMTFSTDELDEQLQQLAIAAQRHLPKTSERHITLTALVSKILNSGRLYRPSPSRLPTHLSGAYDDIYDDVEPLQVSEAELEELCQLLETRLNEWLNSEPFRSIDQRLRSQLNPDEEVRVVIETEDDLLRRLPWHRWNFLEDYPKAEIALSTREFHQINTRSRTLKGKVRILAILGNSAGINIQTDRKLIQELGFRSGVTNFLIEPSRRELAD